MEGNTVTGQEGTLWAEGTCTAQPGEREVPQCSLQFHEGGASSASRNQRQNRNGTELPGEGH